MFPPLAFEFLSSRLNYSTGLVYSNKIVEKSGDKRFYRPIFRTHLTNLEIVAKLLGHYQELRERDELYQLLLFHFQEKQADQFFGLIEETLNSVNPIFQTVFKTFLKHKDKIGNALELPYSNAKLEATNNPIKVIKRNVFGFRKMKRQNSHFHCANYKAREDKFCPLLVLDWSTHYS